MPNIKSYQTPALDIRPTEVGIEATAAVGRRAGTMFREAAGALQDMGNRIGGAVKTAGDEAVNYMEHREISAGAAKLAEMQDGLTNEWNQRAKSADPNDPSVAGEFRETVMEPAFEKFNAAFNTQRGQDWAQSHTAALRNHMFQKQSADMSTLAAHAVHVNAEKTLNNLTSSVYNDPSSLDYSIGTFKTSMDGVVDSSPRLTPAQNAQVKGELTQKANKQLVHSAISGIIANGGDWSKVADKYSEYIDRAELERFAKAEKMQQKADTLTNKQLETYQKQQATFAANESLSKNWTDNVSFDENGHPTIKPQFYRNILDIERQYPGMSTERARSMINWGQAQQREKREVIVTDGPTRSRLMDGMFKTENPTTDVDILKEAADGKLSAHDTSTLLQLHKALEEKPLKGPLYHAAMDAAKGALGHNIMADGPERYSNFMQVFMPEYLKQLRAGTLPPNALDTRDKDSMISKAIDQFRPTPAQMMVGYTLKRFNVTDPSQLNVNNLPGAPAAPSFTPPKGWQFSPSTKQFRDPATNKLYDINGIEVKK